MKIIYNQKEIEALTIKELYELALAKGKENAIVGINCGGECGGCGCPHNYSEEVAPNDVEFEGFYNPDGTVICDCIWLNSH